jgi:hypothetical protein
MAIRMEQPGDFAYTGTFPKERYRMKTSAIFVLALTLAAAAGFALTNELDQEIVRLTEAMNGCGLHHRPLPLLR